MSRSLTQRRRLYQYDPLVTTAIAKPPALLAMKALVEYLYSGNYLKKIQKFFPKLAQLVKHNLVGYKKPCTDFTQTPAFGTLLVSVLRLAQHRRLYLNPTSAKLLSMPKIALSRVKRSRERRKFRKVPKEMRGCCRQSCDG